jgi:hypothetical protein
MAKPKSTKPLKAKTTHRAAKRRTTSDPVSVLLACGAA